MVPAVFLLVLLCAGLVWWLRTRARHACEHALPPAYPGELPIIGHLHLLLTDTTKLMQFLESIATFSLKQGGVVYGKLANTYYYAITDPEDALKAVNGCPQKHFLYSFMANFLGQGLITSTGSIWQHHRKLLSPAFMMSVIHSYLEVFNDQARGLVKNIDAHVGEEKCDTLPHLRKLTLEISCLTTFGIRNLKSSSFFTKYMDAVDKMWYTVTNRFQTVWQHSDFLYSLWVKKKEDKVVTIMNELSDEVIQNYKESSMTGATTDTSYKPIVEQLLQPNGTDILTDVEIRDELNTTIAAAFETTSNALAYTLALLGSYPEVQEKLYEEVMQVLGSDGDVDKYDLQKLLYTEAVIKESLRILPPVAVVARHVDKDEKLKNYTLRPGSDCFILLYGINRHSSWGPDAGQFKPERWLDPASLPANANAFASFSLGKRSCIGKTYAMVAMKVAVAHLVRKYQWTADYTKLQSKLETTVKPVTGHEITLQRRN